VKQYFQGTESVLMITSHPMDSVSGKPAFWEQGQVSEALAQSITGEWLAFIL
jgi:hypothetical protein